MRWQPDYWCARRISIVLPKHFVAPRAKFFPKTLCDLACDWITSSGLLTSISNFCAGTKCCSRLEMEIRSRFSLLAKSSRVRSPDRNVAIIVGTQLDPTPETPGTAASRD